MKMARKKPQQSRKVHGKQLCGRSRITNGRSLVPEIDGRSVWARRLRDLICLHTADLGGEDNLSQAELSLIRRAATLTVELEHLEQRFLVEDGASAADLHLYQRTANSLRRLLESIGLKRRPKDVTPDLDTYLASKRCLEEADA